VEVVHSLAVPSEDALAISSPSGEMTNELIGPECARSGESELGTGWRTPGVDLTIITCGNETPAFRRPDHQAHWIIMGKWLCLRLASPCVPDANCLIV
jgi:hypothetical protein